MKITLITGVAGTTGSQILDYLADTEEVKEGRRKIVGYDNLFRGTVDNIKDHIGKEYFEFVQKDFLDFSVIEFLQSGLVDEVYHMAAVVPTKYFYESPDLTFNENCLKTIQLFDFCRSPTSSAKRFIVGSSSEIYGHISDEDLPVKETTMSHFDAEEVSTRWSYAEGKLLTEHYLNHFADEMERVCHLRFANTYGVRDLDDNHVLPYLVNRVVRNEDIEINKNSERFCRTFLNNHDSARACVELMKSGHNGTAYNVGSQEEVSIDELLSLILDVAEEKGIKYTGQVKKTIERPGDPCRRVLDCTRLYQHTGFKPQVSLRDGVSEMLDVVIDNKRKECK